MYNHFNNEGWPTTSSPIKKKKEKQNVLREETTGDKGSTVT